MSEGKTREKGSTEVSGCYGLESNSLHSPSTQHQHTRSAVEKLEKQVYVHTQHWWTLVQCGVYTVRCCLELAEWKRVYLERLYQLGHYLAD